MKQFRCRAFVVAIAALVAIPLAVVAADKTGSKKEQATYNQAEVMKEADEFFGQRFREFGRMLQRAFFARRRVMREPRFLKLEPLARGEVVEEIAAHLGVRGDA